MQNHRLYNTYYVLQDLQPKYKLSIVHLYFRVLLCFKSAFVKYVLLTGLTDISYAKEYLCLVFA